MAASQSQRSHTSSHRPDHPRPRRETSAERDRRLQEILDRKKALDIQQEELDKQYAELNKAGQDLLSQRGSASRSEFHEQRDGGNRREPPRPEPKKRGKSPSKRDREDRNRGHSGGSHTEESSPNRNSDKYYGAKKTKVSPFSKELAQARIDRKLKVPPTLEMYDGTGDPHDHTYSFEQAMSFHGHDAASMCHLFLSTLKKTAREWIISLPSGSICSWEELTEQFHTRFGSNKRRAKMMTSLLQVKQKPNETLRQYMKRFREAVSEINGIDPKQVIQFLTMGLNVEKSSRLIEEIISKPPQTLPEAYDKVDKFVELEEALANLRGSSKVLGDNPQRDPGGDNADNRNSKNKDQWNGSKDWGSKRPERDYTPLSTSRADIVKEIKDQPFYERPPKIRVFGRQKNGNKYCIYHEAKGHDTEDCYQLKDFLEKHVRNGHLDCYVAERQYKPSPFDRIGPPPTSSGPTGIVDIISGGAVSTMSNRKRKAFIREVHQLSGHPRDTKTDPITFSDEDYPSGLASPHQDALVISAQVGTMILKRMLVDNGSSVDVLYSHAYNRLDLGGRKLEICNESPLYGFGNNPVRIAGTIELPVIFGSSPKQASIMIRFYVVHVESNYNAILGRTTLSALRAITSIPHLKMKFPTENGIGEAVGDQDLSRRCYLQTVQATSLGVSKEKSTMKIELEPFTEGGTEPMATPAEETEEIPLFRDNRQCRLEPDYRGMIRNKWMITPPKVMLN